MNEEASDSVLKKDEEASDSVLKKDEEASDSVLKKDEEASDSVLKKDEEARDSVLKKDEEASDSVLKKDEEDFLHVAFSLCPGCLQHKILKILNPCYHTLCEDCLKGENKEEASSGDKTHDNGDGIVCPTCSTKIEFPDEGGIEALPTSNLFFDLESSADGKIHPHGLSTPVNYSDGVPASPMSPMPPVAPPKSPGSIAGDSGIATDEINDEPKDEGMFNILQKAFFGIKKFCPTHNEKELDTYCQKCEKIVCSMCVKSEHVDHPISNLKDLAKIRRKKVDKMMVEANKSQLALAVKNSARVKAENDNLQKEVMDTLAQMRSSFDELRKILEVKEEDCLTQLNQSYERKRAEIDLAEQKSNNVVDALTFGPECLRKQLRKISNDRYSFMALSPQILAKADEILAMAGKMNRDDSSAPTINFTMDQDFTRLKEEINNLRQET